MQTTVPAGYVMDASRNCVLVTQATDVCPNVEGMQTTVPAGYVKDASGNCVVATVTAVVQAKTEVKTETRTHVVAASPTATPATATAAKPTAAAGPQEQPASGVLGATASSPQDSIAETATSGTLPFTGIPLWIVALIGAVLLAAGFALRRGAQH
jgi:hypothetical protein